MKTKLLSILLFAALIAAMFGAGQPTQSARAAGGWELVGSTLPSGGDVRLVVDNGTPYVAYVIFDNNAHKKISVKKFNGTSWVDVGAPNFNPGSAARYDLAVENGVPYVAYSDSTDQDAYYDDKVKVMKFNGANWVDVGDTNSYANGINAHVSLAVYNGAPYVSFSELSLAYAKYYVSVKYLSGGSWEDLGQPWFSYPHPRNDSDLAMHNGTPYVAYASYDLPLWGPVVQKFSGGWETVGDPDFAPDRSSAVPKIAIDSDSGTPYVAYAIPGAQYPLPTNDAVVMKFTDTGWQYVGAMRFVERVSPTFSLAVGNGAPYFSFLDKDHNFKASVMKFNGSAWEYVGSPGFSAGQQAYNTSLAVYNGTPYIAFPDYFPPNETKITVMKYVGQTPPTQTATFRSAGAQDGWILESSETSNKGGTLNSTATTFRLGDDAAKKQYRAILSFKTANLPDNAVITKVTLKVKRQGVMGGGDPVNAFQGFMADVKKGTFGTSALQAADFQTAANKTVGPVKPTPNGGWYTLNLAGAKAFINKLASNGGLTQIRLRFKLDDNNNAVANYLSLFSGNAPLASRPQLIVEYYVP
jgi:hypothetical protein